MSDPNSDAEGEHSIKVRDRNLWSTSQSRDNSSTGYDSTADSLDVQISSPPPSIGDADSGPDPDAEIETYSEKELPPALDTIPHELLFRITALLPPPSHLALLLTTPTLHKILSLIILSRHQTSASFTQAYTNSLIATPPAADRSLIYTPISPEDRKIFLQTLTHDLPNHVFCVKCNKLHSLPTKIPLPVIRPCYLQRTPFMPLLTNIQIQMRTYNEGTWEPLDARNTFATTYHPISTRQRCLDGLIINGRYFLRAQNALLLPPGANCYCHVARRFQTQYVEACLDFLLELGEFAEFIARRYGEVVVGLDPERVRRLLRTQNLGWMIVYVLAEMDTHRFLSATLSMRNMRGKGFRVFVTMWMDLGWCRDRLEEVVRPLGVVMGETAALDPLDIVEREMGSVVAEWDGSDQWRGEEVDQELLKKRVRFVKE